MEQWNNVRTPPETKVSHKEMYYSGGFTDVNAEMLVRCVFRCVSKVSMCDMLLVHGQ